jgi:hypothetical protein
MVTPAERAAHIRGLAEDFPTEYYEDLVINGKSAKRNWQHENRYSPRSAVDSEALGLCPLICPEHHRHCDAGDLGHTQPHACSLCEGW